MKITKISILIISFVLIFSVSAYAQNVPKSIRENQPIFISKGQVAIYDSLGVPSTGINSIVTGGDISMKSGSENLDVEILQGENLVYIGSDVVISGDISISGGTLTINALEENLFETNGSLTITGNSTIFVEDSFPMNDINKQESIFKNNKVLGSLEKVQKKIRKRFNSRKNGAIGGKKKGNNGTVGASFTSKLEEEVAGKNKVLARKSKHRKIIGKGIKGKGFLSKIFGKIWKK